MGVPADPGDQGDNDSDLQTGREIKQMPKYYPPVGDICVDCRVAPRKPGFVKCEKCLERDKRQRAELSEKMQALRKAMLSNEPPRRKYAEGKPCARCNTKPRTSYGSYCKDCMREYKRIERQKQKERELNESEKDNLPKV